MADLTGVLLATYGSPASLDHADVASYLEHIVGRPPTDEQVERLRDQYEAAGGVAALPEMTERQADLLQEALDDRGGDVLVVWGYKHAAPFLADVAEDLAVNVDRGVVVPLAPHYNTMSVAGYHEAVRDGLRRVGVPPPFHYVRSYHVQPRLVAAWADRVEAGLDALAGRAADPVVVFTAHSLPARVTERDDPYPAQVLATCEAVAGAAGAAEWLRAYQSAPDRGDWLGPDVLDALEEAAAEGFDGAVVAPVGFASDHMETRFDLDVEARAKAEELDLAFERVPAPNDDPAFIACLAEVVRAALEEDDAGAAGAAG